MAIGAQTRLFGVIGHPLGHTLSPALHNAAFAALGIDAVYLALPVPPDRLAGAMAGVRAWRIEGLSVTVPHKVAVTKLLDGMTGEALAAGAANTLFWDGDRLLGHNTDVAGYAAMLAVAGACARRAVVLGAGGAARAVCLALRRAGCEVTVVARDEARARGLVEALEAGAGPSPGAGCTDASGACAGGPTASAAAGAWDSLAEHLARADLLVNCTPVGTAPGADASPVADLSPLAAGSVVHDLVYRPRETRLLREARQRGLQTVGGDVMLVAQGAAAFRLWTGFAPPHQVMLEALERAT